MKTPKRNAAIHWAGGIRYDRGMMLPGFPCCCSGARCIEIAKQPERLTRKAEQVTCKPCLVWMEKDNTGTLVLRKGENQ